MQPAADATWGAYPHAATQIMQEVTGDQSWMETVGGLILSVAAMITAIGVILGFAGWLVWPRVRSALEEIVQKVNVMEQQLTPNGESTMQERSKTTADRLVTIERLQHKQTELLDGMHGGLHQLRSQFGQHLQEVDLYRQALERQGIELPVVLKVVEVRPPDPGHTTDPGQ